MTRLQYRQTVVIVVLTIGALSVPKLIARKWAMSEGSDVKQTAGIAFLNTFGR